MEVTELATHSPRHVTVDARGDSGPVTVGPAWPNGVELPVCAAAGDDIEVNLDLVSAEVQDVSGSAGEAWRSALEVREARWYLIQ